MWRGQYNPTPGSAEANQFWGDYENYLVDVAEIAESHHVDALTVGTEYNALDGDGGHNANWNSVINAVRNEYAGPLGYAANWDQYDDVNVTTAIWEHPEIDFIGIDSYFTGMVSNAQADASGTFPNPSFINTMTDAWNNKLNDQILPFAAARKGGAGMPVAFTEVGYLPRNRTSLDPQQQNSGSQPVDTGEQIMAFNGLINSLDGRGNEFHALDVWQWGMSGSDGSEWNMDTTLPANQPNNLPAAQWLAQFVGTGVLPLAGDFNRDGAVDAGDYVAWRRTAGQHVLQYAGADGDGDGIISDDDYAIWRANFGATASSDAGLRDAVPEPQILAQLLAIIFCGIAVWRGRIAC